MKLIKSFRIHIPDLSGEIQNIKKALIKRIGRKS